VMSPKARKIWPSKAGPAPHFRVELSLPYWLAVGEDHPSNPAKQPRARLIHHELMHCATHEFVEEEQVIAKKPKARNHCVEEFVMTVRRYGLHGRLQELFVEAGVPHLPKPEQPDGVLPLDLKSRAAAER
jgi:hypothetical protein